MTTISTGPIGPTGPTGSTGSVSAGTGRLEGRRAEGPRDVGPEAARGWAWAGLGAAVLGIVSGVASGMMTAVYTPELAGDAARITERMAEQTTQLWVFHTTGVGAALLLVVFAAGLRRLLGHRVAPDSLLPTVASTGLLLLSGILLVGTALNTEFGFGLMDPSLLVPETAVMYGHWTGTVSWVWAGVGPAALAVAAAGFRYGGAGRFVTWSSALLGVLTTLLAISPAQYMAAMTGQLWLLLFTAACVLKRR